MHVGGTRAGTGFDKDASGISNEVLSLSRAQHISLLFPVELAHGPPFVNIATTANYGGEVSVA